MDRRVLLGTLPGLTGLALGTIAAAAKVPALSVLAGACALTAAAASISLLAALNKKDAETAALRQRVADLEESAASEHEEAEAAASDLAELMAGHQAPDPEPEEDTGPAPAGMVEMRYFETALEQRVAAARRQLHPVTLLLLTVEAQDLGPHERRQALTVFTTLLDETLREADISCHVGEGAFAVILEDTPEAGGVWAAERLRVALGRQTTPEVHLAAGVAAYPSHALDARDLAARAEAALVQARSGGSSQVEIASAD